MQAKFQSLEVQYADDIKQISAATINSNDNKHTEMENKISELEARNKKLEEDLQKK